jgi:hypothetical protein
MQNYAKGIPSGQDCKNMSNEIMSDGMMCDGVWLNGCMIE